MWKPAQNILPPKLKVHPHHYTVLTCLFCNSWHMGPSWWHLLSISCSLFQNPLFPKDKLPHRETSCVTTSTQGLCPYSKCYVYYGVFSGYDKHRSEKTVNPDNFFNYHACYNDATTNRLQEICWKIYELTVNLFKLGIHALQNFTISPEN